MIRVIYLPPKEEYTKLSSLSTICNAFRFNTNPLQSYCIYLDIATQASHILAATA